ncbi:NAD(P)H-dependent oxidoreductase [Mucilaginibacter sp. ZT4R22]|uniref:FMN dependent NADH:quinone oxidoreductase n=1 Tax=Mucilaginibacter pankratovii TaxID=2772110 RepID=A0ABR7WW73_9SPHI|nr:NAD(P)H-dependent oxidoreductase [Mucilaginibacter pankratovii]MBD1365689.1 NAD(P)H-dependent oxidoreductase [Mucilaginibacter pankratovii]
MKKVLHIISSPRTEGSVSRKLGNAVVDKIRETHPGSVVKDYDLSKILFPHMGEALISSFYTPEENRTPEQTIAVKHSDDIIAELQESDILVIDSPMYNFTITSTLKTFLDHITRPGVTFRYTENGPEGLIKGKKVYIAFSSGWIYDENAPVIPEFNMPYIKNDFNVPFLKVLLGFLGMTDVTAFRADGAELHGIKETAYSNAVDSILIA